MLLVARPSPDISRSVVPAICHVPVRPKIAYETVGGNGADFQRDGSLPVAVSEEGGADGVCEVEGMGSANDDTPIRR